MDLALRQKPEEIIRAVEASELRGRGGTAYPTGREWRAVSQQAASEKYVVANADEGDPGAYIDRFILEDNPHGVFEALAIAGYAVGARRGYICLRAAYPDARRRLAAAIEEARHARLLGAPLFGTDFSFDLQLDVGRGSYVCGEETALLNAIEGQRPRCDGRRDPYPVDMTAVIKATRDHGVLLEINAQPDRPDLNDLHVQVAREAGVKLVISTDAHRVQELDCIRFGVDHARRGWCEAKDVANTYELAVPQELIRK